MAVSHLLVCMVWANKKQQFNSKLPYKLSFVVGPALVEHLAGKKRETAYGTFPLVSVSGLGGVRACPV